MLRQLAAKIGLAPLAERARVSRLVIGSAMDGLPLFPESARRIRAYLSALEAPHPSEVD